MDQFFVMKIIIHAGLYKTATTSLQTFLFQNRDTFIRSGIYIPLEFSRRNCLARDFNNRAHHLLYHQLRKNDEKFNASLKLKIADVLSSAKELGCHTVLFSTELFSEALSSDFDRIEDEFFGAKIHLVYTVRNVHEIAESYSNQRKKTRILGLEDSSLSRKDFECGYILRALADVAESRGADRVSIFEFVPSQMNRMLEEFCIYLGVRFSEFGSPLIGKSNSSFSWEDYWLMQRYLAENKKLKNAEGRDRRRMPLNLTEKVVNETSRKKRTMLVTLNLADQEKVSEVNRKELRRIAAVFPSMNCRLVLAGAELSRFYKKKYYSQNIQRKPSLMSDIRNSFDEGRRRASRK
mgnify:CR=1 FL=1